MDYCISVYLKEQEEKLYKTWITECLKTIAEVSGHGAGMKVTIQSFRDLAGWIETDDRTGAEIAADIINRAGLRFKE
ncbi:MAG: hypothetical protein IJI19_06065 [Ruminococcus sp.]|nr:hypothetical protein [Ruminococcus sp.]